MEPRHHIPSVLVPQGDDGYFEAMTRAVFQAGIDWDIIRQRWPAFQQAFRSFAVEQVARFGPDEIDELLGPESGIVRNYRKIDATIANAAAFLRVREQYGSFHAYLRSFDGQPYAAVVKDLKGRFRHVGDTVAFVFLHGVGEVVPHWEERHIASGGSGPALSRSTTPATGCSRPRRCSEAARGR